MRKSRLPKGGTNLFQQIKMMCAKATDNCQTLYKLSIGQPVGPAITEARIAAAIAVLSDQESMHEYQDNGSPGVSEFAARFIQAHVRFYLAKTDLACLPIPGIKPMLGLIPLACGHHINSVRVLSTTRPGYPTPADWCSYLGCEQYPAELKPENEFLFDPRVIDFGDLDLIMLNYPHNPTAKVANKEWLKQVCQYASEKNVRVFNDAAYSILAYDPDHCPLAEVAVDFPDLSWAEAYSASKAGNFTGWRVGAIVGSPDFIGDIATIKGNTDSGFAAPMAAGVLHLYENHMDLIQGVRNTYQRRADLLIQTLLNYGMRLAVKPGAGFFTLWQTPNTAFGQEITSSEQFNALMIEKTGIVGVHFEPFIRYAVCGDVEAMLPKIDEGFDAAQVSYN